MADFESEQNQKLKISGTLWAAYNAAVWAIDYKRRTSRDLVDDLCLAEGARLKEKARKAAEGLLDADQVRLSSTRHQFGGRDIALKHEKRGRHGVDLRV